MSNRALEEILDFVTSQPKMEDILHFEHSPEILERVEYLEAAENSGTISSDELDELRQFVRAHEFMQQLKLRAKRRLGIEES